MTKIKTMEKAEIEEQRINWGQLKEFCNNLSEEQLKNKVILWREDEVIQFISAESLEEDYFIDKDSPENGCFPESEKRFIEDAEFRKVYDKGFPLLIEIF